MRCLHNSGLSRLLERLENNGIEVAINNQNINQEHEPNTTPNVNVFFWGGKFHKYPEAVELPNGGVLEAWQCWIAGNPSKKFRPLRKLEPIDCRSQAIM